MTKKIVTALAVGLTALSVVLAGCSTQESTTRATQDWSEDDNNIANNVFSILTQGYPDNIDDCYGGPSLNPIVVYNPTATAQTFNWSYQEKLEEQMYIEVAPSNGGVTAPGCDFGKSESNSGSATIPPNGSLGLYMVAGSNGGPGSRVGEGWLHFTINGSLNYYDFGASFRSIDNDFVSMTLLPPYSNGNYVGNAGSSDPATGGWLDLVQCQVGENTVAPEPDEVVIQGYGDNDPDARLTVKSSTIDQPGVQAGVPQGGPDSGDPGLIYQKNAALCFTYNPSAG